MKKKIALIVSSPMTFKAFYKNHIEKLQEKYDVTLIANFEQPEPIFDGVKQIALNLERKPSVFSDLKSLKEMIKIFRTEKFILVHSTTPKAGFITQIAGFLTGTKFRLHIFTGQVWASQSGLKRQALKKVDVAIASLATHLLADSESQVEFLIKESIPVKSKIKVLGNGSISGVDLNKFTPKDSNDLKGNLNLKDKVFIFLFIGRLNKDKGIFDLIESFEIVHSRHPQAALLIVGSDEENILPFIQNHALYNKSIFYHEATPQPQDFMAMADVLCLPSYREGFGTVIIEASACGTPSIGSRIYGLSDAIEDGKSGYLFTVGSVEDLAEKMIFSIENTKKLQEVSKYGMQRVQEEFSDGLSSELLLGYYHSILAD
ncbi:Glycosyl transferase family 1 domain-containing protein [Psychrobacter okhotskensis]|uniref:glycosyltransferase n=1 Tax=Psychrobacter okhotskensis TaxID=212403 RepID=UPI003F54D9DC